MAAAAACPSLALFLVAIAAFSVSGVWSSSNKSFTLVNSCAYTVWPGILSGAGSPPLGTTGFELLPGESQTLAAPPGWSGRLWGRTLCATDAATGRFACATGDCGSGRPDCAGGAAAPPATLAEFTLDGGGLDFYDVSLVDGSNLPMLVAPTTSGGTAGTSTSTNCAPTGCVVDVNAACPAALRVGDGVACRSACDAFGSPEYCCAGAYGSPAACRPSAYSQYFKNACPRAYSYAYDDATSTFTCAAADDTDYTITFCPTTASIKSSSPDSGAPGDLPLVNGTVMAYAGGDQVSAAAAVAARPPSRLVAVAVAVLLLTLAAGGRSRTPASLLMTT